MNRNNLLKQKQIPLLGALNQIVGGAMGWVGMFTFLLSAITAWNTSTLERVRDTFPWLNIFIFTAAMVLAIIIAVWLQHKYIQPSSVNYWRKMFYEDNPSEDRMMRIEKRQKIIYQMLLEQVTDKEKREAIERSLDEV